MKLPRFELIQPHSLKEACSIFSEYDGKAALLAGGTALMVALRLRLVKPSLVIGLKGLTELESIRRGEGGGLVIGSMTTLETLSNADLISAECAPLAEAARLVAVPGIRHKATIGGNLCQDTRCIYYNQSEFWRSGQNPCFKLGGGQCNAVAKGHRCQAVYQGDLAPMLMAMGAEVKAVSAGGERIIALPEFFTGRGEKPNGLNPGEIVTEVRIPSPRGAGGAYEKLRVRQGMDFPMAGAAVVVKAGRGGAVERVRVVLGAVASSPVEVARVPALLEGKRLTDELLEAVSREAQSKATPAANLAIDREYRREMTGELAVRALRRALAAARG